MKFSKSFNGVLRYNPVNPRYFTDDTGKSVYLTGSHTWAVIQDAWKSNSEKRLMDYDGFLQMMEDNGHNFLRLWQVMQIKSSENGTAYYPLPYRRTGPALARDGLPRFDLTQWNEEYFSRLVERINKAAAKGIYVSVMMFEACAIKHSSLEKDAWLYHLMNPGNNVNEITDNPVIDNGRAWDFFSLNCPQLLKWQKDFIKKVVDTVNDMDNVIYEICNEMPNRKEALAWQEHLCTFIHEYEKSKPKQHPVGITAEGGYQDNTWLFPTCADWISPGNGRLFEYRFNPPAADGSKVIISDTDHLWGHGGDMDWVWRSFTRGLNVIFMDPWEPHPGDFDLWRFDENVTYNQRYFYAWDPLRRNLGYTRYFADRMDMNACVPRNDLCTSTFCLADKGKEYLFYFPSGGHEGLDLWDADGIFAVEWFNPLTGLTYKSDDIKGNNCYDLAAPFEGPAVLYIYKK